MGMKGDLPHRIAGSLPIQRLRGIPIYGRRGRASPTSELEKFPITVLIPGFPEPFFIGLQSIHAETSQNVAATGQQVDALQQAGGH